MAPTDAAVTAQSEKARSEQFLRTLAAASLLICFQAFMVAALLHSLAGLVTSSVEANSLVVPAYLSPYGIAALVYGSLSGRFGQGRPSLRPSWPLSC